MYARSTTVRGDPQKIDDGIAYVRDEVMPAVQGMSGCVGLSMLCDRDSGRCIVTTAWADDTAMRATEEAVRSMRERAAEIFGGQIEVNEWEIGLLHRMREAPEGACTRVTWTRGDPAQMDRMTDTFRMALLPRLEDLPGFCSVSVLMNRQNGMCALAATYESREAVRASREAVAAMRDEFTQQLGMEVMDMAEFDLVLAHLRVPETV
jgi:heme-degrading monooxygenase HmoA